MFFISLYKKKRTYTKYLTSIAHRQSKREYLPAKKEKSSQIFLEFIKVSWKYHINLVSTNVCKSIGMFYRARCILNIFLRKQLYFSFTNFYLNYSNITWASTNKSKLQALCCHQKYAVGIINFRDKFASAKPILEQIKAMIVYEMNIFQALCFMYLCKNETHSQFSNIFKYLRKNLLNLS